ncbi:MAG: lamin tail domain-containing protein [Barnesiella sp.]|nr:lamin tail domain-containing protein [Barnesiella sp.]MBD5331024.1 lamin tail domain-containing protein [Bacteroides sp.]MBD5375278.1 lamin tail domain-containing protein [Bacteroides sp.]MDE7460984.1 OadG family protein [Paramuribaculum sp.]
MKKRLTILFVALTAFVVIASAQGRKALRINEVMVANESSVVDDYGYRNGWVELFNSNFAPLEISSVFITDDPANPKKYPVPLGDVNTRIPKRQHIVFWADGEPSKGTFHMNFRLKPNQDNWIGVYDADGITLIDEVTIPASLLPDQTYARKVDGEGSGAEAWEVRTGQGDLYVTPSSNNIIKDTNNKVDMFAEKDKNGFGMTVMAMCIVFSALLLLSVCFYIISKIGESISKRNKVKSQGMQLSELEKDNRPDHDSGEEIAAIVMALHEHLDTHDRENTVLTINKVKRAYSPWSSKIYSMRENPHR